MPSLSLALFKKQVRADDFDDDDELLQHLLDTAGDAVVRATNREEDDLLDEAGALPLMLQHAAMMLAAHWYNQRESVSAVQMHEVPDGIAALIKPYRKLSEG